MITFGYGQDWIENNAVYNTSGVPSLTFSTPRFADLDHDNDPDLVLSGSDSPPIILENIGSANHPVFSETGFISHNITAFEGDLCIPVDLDLDGDDDLIAAGYNGLTFFKNMGDSTTAVFERDTLVFSGLNTGHQPAPTAADINGDGMTDILIGLSENGSIKYFINSGTEESPEFLEENAISTGIDVGLFAYPELVDPDGDGDWDLIMGHDDLNLLFFRNDGSPQTPNWVNDPSYCSELAGNHYFATPTMEDLNGDGLLDIVYGHYGGPIQYFNNTGTSVVPVWTENSAPFGGILDVGGASNPCLYDWDQDGDLDLISGFNLGNIKYFRNIGTPAGPAWEEAHSVFNTIEGESIYSSVAVGDLDQNGSPDLIMGFLTNVLVYYENTGSQFLLNTSQLTDLNIGWWLIPRLADMDGDGDLDLVVASDDGNLHYFENQGTVNEPEFVLSEGYFNGVSGPANVSPALADLDQDGDMDLVLGGISGNLDFYENTGTAANPVWTENTTLLDGDIAVTQNSTPAFGDLDGDGDRDLTIGSYDGSFSYYENNHPVVSTDPVKPILPDRLSIQSVFPNPFNRSVTFSITGIRAGVAVIDIYDLSGRHCYQISSSAPNGKEVFRVRLEMPSFLSSGVYLYRVSELNSRNSSTISGKMVYVK